MVSVAEEVEIWTNTPEAWSKRVTLDEPWEVAGWSQRGQTLRFMAVMHHLCLRPGDTLLDFGCGTGELSRWLPSVRYFGWDWAPGLRERAKQDHPEATFLDKWDYAYEMDHIVAVGPFNLLDHWSKEETWQTLFRLWGVTRRTMVVSLYRGDDPQCITYKAAEIAELASVLTDDYVIDGSYLMNDLILRMNQ